MIGINFNGTQLLNSYSNFNILMRWISVNQVNWFTGQKIYSPDTVNFPVGSHAGAFVAAVANRFDMYILRPPVNTQANLAYNQATWFQESSSAYGWTEIIATGMENIYVLAQNAANQGNVVVSSYQNTENGEAHTNIILPSFSITQADLETNGPNCLNVGAINYNQQTLKICYQEFMDAFDENMIKFYQNSIPTF